MNPRRTALAALAALPLAALAPAAGAAEHVAPGAPYYFELKDLATDEVVCGSYEGVCEVPPGRYREQTFDARWVETGDRVVTVGASTTVSGVFATGVSTGRASHRGVHGVSCPGGERILSALCSVSVGGEPVAPTSQSIADNGTVFFCITKPGASVTTQLVCLGE